MSRVFQITLESCSLFTITLQTFCHFAFGELVSLPILAEFSFFRFITPNRWLYTKLGTCKFKRFEVKQSFYLHFITYPITNNH